MATKSKSENNAIAFCRNARRLLGPLFLFVKRSGAMVPVYDSKGTCLAFAGGGGYEQVNQLARALAVCGWTLKEVGRLEGITVYMLIWEETQP